MVKSSEIKAPDSHELIVLLWVQKIIRIHWDNNDSPSNNTGETGGNTHYSFAK